MPSPIRPTRNFAAGDACAAAPPAFIADDRRRRQPLFSPAFASPTAVRLTHNCSTIEHSLGAGRSCRQGRLSKYGAIIGYQRSAVPPQFRSPSTLHAPVRIRGRRRKVHRRFRLASVLVVRPQQDRGADHRQNPAGGMEFSVRRLPDEARDDPTDDRSRDAQSGGQPEARARRSPGTMARAIRPTTKPTMMVPMMLKMPMVFTFHAVRKYRGGSASSAAAVRRC